MHPCGVTLLNEIPVRLEGLLDIENLPELIAATARAYAFDELGGRHICWIEALLHERGIVRIIFHRCCGYSSPVTYVDYRIVRNNGKVVRLHEIIDPR